MVIERSFYSPFPAPFHLQSQMELLCLLVLFTFSAADDLTDAPATAKLSRSFISPGLMNSFPKIR